MCETESVVQILEPAERQAITNNAVMDAVLELGRKVDLLTERVDDIELAVEDGFEADFEDDDDDDTEWEDDDEMVVMTLADCRQLQGEHQAMRRRLMELGEVDVREGESLYWVESGDEVFDQYKD